MVQKLVLDSSVIVKWLNQQNEGNVNEANKIMEGVISGEIELIAPELAKYEIGNVLLFAKKLSAKEAEIPLKNLFVLPIKFMSQSQELEVETFSIADAVGITYYDAVFMALAKQEDAVLVTDNPKHQKEFRGIKVISLDHFE